jgi:N-acylglucosamine-6-phosphate 2-epimerase
VSTVDRLVGGLVVSCQAPPGHPLRVASVIARLAECAVAGGAVGVRVNSPEDVRAVRAAVPALPIIGLHKVAAADRDVITPRFRLAVDLVEAGADIVAFEATDRAELPPAGMIERIHAELGVPVMADVATVEAGLRAFEAGAELVGSTLSGYTPDSPPQDEPDFDLVAALAAAGVRTVAEGRLSTAEHVRTAFAAGAYSVVIGTAITDPIAITRRLVSATPVRPGGHGWQ